MNFLIMGLPGVGKGTQSEFLVKEYNLDHISTGDLFRNEVSSGSQLGKELNVILETGNLVPDELTISILKERLLKSNKAGFLLDGFPRTLAQAVALDELLIENEMKLDGIIDIILDQDVIIKRLSGRIICSDCGKSYHEIFSNPKVDNVCDVCNGKLYKRKDDQLESIMNRLLVAEEMTLPVIKHYDQKGLVLRIESTEKQSSQEIYEMMKKVIDND